MTVMCGCSKTQTTMDSAGAAAAAAGAADRVTADGDPGQRPDTSTTSQETVGAGAPSGR